MFTVKYDTHSKSNSSDDNPGADPGGVDGVASHPPFQMKKKNKESGFSSNFFLN